MKRPYDFIFNKLAAKSAMVVAAVASCNTWCTADKPLATKRSGLCQFKVEVLTSYVFVYGLPRKRYAFPIKRLQ